MGPFRLWTDIPFFSWLRASNNLGLIEADMTYMLSKNQRDHYMHAATGAVIKDRLSCSLNNVSADVSPSVRHPDRLCVIARYLCRWLSPQQAHGPLQIHARIGLRDPLKVVLYLLRDPL